MKKAKYLNKKYYSRKRKRRVAAITTTLLSLFILSMSAIFSIDANIRTTMLTTAPPIMAAEESGWLCYTIDFFGNKATISFQSLSNVADTLYGLCKTPPARIRLVYQLRAYLADDLPSNERSDMTQYDVV